MTAEDPRKFRQIDNDIAAIYTIVSEHTAKLDEHTAILDQHTAKLDEHTGKLDEISRKLDTVVTALGAD